MTNQRLVWPLAGGNVRGVSKADWFRVVKIFHLLFAIGGFGPMFATAIIGARIPKAPIPARLPMTQVEDVIGTRLITPLTGLALVSGLALVPLSSVYEFEQFWISASVVLWLVGFCLGTGIINRSVKEMVTIQESLTGPPTAHQVDRLEALGKRAGIVGGLTYLVLVVIVVLMVWKPGLS